MKKGTKGILAITASALGFALMALFVRLCDDYGAPVPSVQKAFFRNSVAFAIALAAFLRLRAAGRAPMDVPSSVRPYFLMRALLGTAGILANFYALSHITIAEGQTLNKTAPFFTVICAWILFGERATRRQLAVLFVAAVGMFLIVKPAFAGADALPLAMGLLGGICAGGAYACVRALRTHGVNPVLIVLFFSTFSSLACVPFMIMHFHPMTGPQVLILAGAGVGAAMGQFGITLAYGYAAPREIAIYDYSNILFTSALGWLFLAQVPDLLSFIGIVLIVFAAIGIFRHVGAKN